MAAFTLRVMAASIMLLSLSMRASKILCTDALIIAVTLGMAMLASAAVFAGNLTPLPWLVMAHVTGVMVLQRRYGALHPVLAYRRIRGHR
jgi:hypothetical protein